MKRLAVAAFLTLSLMASVFFIRQVQAEPALLEVLIYLGFSNVNQVNLETFPMGKYTITLYAEFAGNYEINELSHYQTGTTSYNLIFAGPEGNSGYVVPPIVKTFTVSYTFGISFYCAGHRYFTQNGMNPDGQTHCQVYQNLDTPNMYLIGFENNYGGGDRDYQDMVFSIQRVGTQTPVGGYSVAHTPYAILGNIGESSLGIFCYSLSLLAFCGVMSWARRKRE